MKRRAFTLIELLVVIAVIGILAAIFLPALARSKAVAKRIHCVANVKQLALATHLYVDDYEDHLPPMAAVNRNDWISNWDWLLLDGYLDRNTNVFQCAGNSRPQGRILSSFNFAYGLNDVGLNEDSPSSYYHGVSSFPFSRSSVKLGSVVSPADCVSLGDTAGWVIANVFQNNSRIPWGVNPPFLSPIARVGVVPRYTFYLTRRHYGNANVAFLDGHVEHGSLRDWTLPVESVHRRWHWDGKAHLDRLVYRDAENWSPLYGIDEKPPEDG